MLETCARRFSVLPPYQQRETESVVSGDTASRSKAHRLIQLACSSAPERPLHSKTFQLTSRCQMPDGCRSCVAQFERHQRLRWSQRFVHQLARLPASGYAHLFSSIKRRRTADERSSELRVLHRPARISASVTPARPASGDCPPHVDDNWLPPNA